MTSSFAALGVNADLVEVLSARGITEPFPIQTLTIPDGLAGRDVCGKARTGSGKTLAFGLPILERVGQAAPATPRALILVPTRELALQVHDELAPLATSRNKAMCAIYGGASMDDQIDALSKGVEIVVATPGRMIDLIDRKEVSVREVAHVVIDEADRMADMGFLPQVEWILRQIDVEHQTLLFSATLDGVVDGLVKRYQHDPVFHEVESRTVTVEEMQHVFLQVHEMDKMRVAAAIASGVGRTIMFTRTKRAADKLERQLKDEGVKASAIHGDLPQRVRERALKQFSDGTLSVLVATDVAARGIHVDEVDVVVHFDPPEGAKTYLHRSGRTARAGAQGCVVTLVLWDEELEVRRIQKRIGIDQPFVEVFSNDDRLGDLSTFLDDNPSTLASEGAASAPS